MRSSPAISGLPPVANLDTPMPRLVLGSRSSSRRKLLERLSLPFSVVPPDVDESRRPEESPEALVSRLSEQKARAVADRIGGAGLVIGSDQIALLGDTVLGKPGDHAGNVVQLEMASGRWMELRTGLAVLDAASGRIQVDVIPFAVRFRPLTANDVEAYVSRERAYECAGGFRAEGLGCMIFERMRGNDPTALQGLPMIRLCEMLRAAGLDVLHARPGSSCAGRSGGQERTSKPTPGKDREPAVESMTGDGGRPGKRTWRN